VARFTVTGTVWAPEGEGSDIAAAVKEETNRLWAEKHGAEPKVRVVAVSDSGAPASFEEAIAANVEDILKHQPQMQDAASAFMESLIIQAWTVFKSFAGDLWIKTVNTAPRYLAPLTGDAARISSLAGMKHRLKPAVNDGDAAEPTRNTDEDDEEFDDIAEASDKRITLGKVYEITRGSYDLADRMGDFLVASNRVSFATLEGIRAAYSSAFSEKLRKARTDRIDASLASRKIDTLCKARNLLVHKAGFADPEYIEETKGLDLPRLGKGERIKIDGGLVRSLVEPVLLSCIELIKGVDSWMSLTSGHNPG
jgi:hypothetical protein